MESKYKQMLFEGIRNGDYILRVEISKGVKRTTVAFKSLIAVLSADEQDMCHYLMAHHRFSYLGSELTRTDLFEESLNGYVF